MNDLLETVEGTSTDSVAESMPLLLRVGGWTLRQWSVGGELGTGMTGIFAHHSGCKAIVQATMMSLRKCLDCNDPVPDEIFATWYLLCIDEGVR